MKHILCYGDSLTWGYDAETSARFPYDKRWTGILQKELGHAYRIIEEGLNGRTTVFNDAFTPNQAYGVGADVLPMILSSHAPLDLVIIMLGTNDFQAHRHADAKTAARGCGSCINQVFGSNAGRDNGIPKVLLVAPPVPEKPVGFMEVAFGDDLSGIEKMAHYYEVTAEFYGVGFMNAAKEVKTNGVDGIHLNEKDNALLAQCFAEKIRVMLGS